MLSQSFKSGYVDVMSRGNLTCLSHLSSLKMRQVELSYHIYVWFGMFENVDLLKACSLFIHNSAIKFYN